MDATSSARTVIRAAAKRLRVVPPPLAIFIWSRLLIWTIAIYAWVWFVPRPAKPPNSSDLGYATEIWARADSGWFLSIA